MESSESKVYLIGAGPGDPDLLTLKAAKILAQADAGAAAGPESSMLKVTGTLVRLEINDLARRALGPYALPFSSEALEEGYNEEPIGPDYANPIAAKYFNNRKMPIFAGSNEVQRGIITKTKLGF